MVREYQGDDVFDAFLALGWDVRVQSDGNIVAIPEGGRGTPVTDEIQEDGNIKWPLTDIRGALQILKNARVKELQARAEAAKEANEQAAIRPEFVI